MQWHGATVGTVKGRKDVAGLFAGVVASLPNAHASTKDIFGQGDQVVVRVVVRGTQKGALLGILATGRTSTGTVSTSTACRAARSARSGPATTGPRSLFYTGTYKAPWIP